jgi:hypothetical protein
LFKKSENLHEIHLLVYHVVKKVSNDSEKVMMHIATKAYLSHTCHCHLARDPHPYVGCVVPVTWNHLKILWDSYGSKL